MLHSEPKDLAKDLGVLVEKLQAEPYIGEHHLSEVHRVSGFAGFDFGVSALSFYNTTTKLKS